MSKQQKPTNIRDVPKIRGYKTRITYTTDKNGILREHISYTPKAKQRFNISVPNPYNLSIFHYVFFLLFIIAFFHAITGSEQIMTFSGLLRALEQAPSIPTDWIATISNLTIKDDWGVFNFLRTFINTFSGILSVLMYLVTGIAQIITYIGYFLGVFFGYV